MYRAIVTTTRSATETSAGLMRLAADGDELAFAGIVDAHDADMSSVCFMVTGGDVDHRPAALCRGFRYDEAGILGFQDKRTRALPLAVC